MGLSSGNRRLLRVRQEDCPRCYSTAPQAPRFIESRSTDPYINLALEACLMRSVREGGPILYLWQNERTVVIGRNQCASAECDIERLERDGGHLARRRSGGGAVYHDFGNLNFTFVTTPGDYDQVAQTDIILNAVRTLGIDAERTGRNDLVVSGGQKFSGHAYQHTNTASCHHGTIMVAVDVDALGRYLTVSPLKLSAKGVRSVRSRVANLQLLRPDLTIGELKDALRVSFERSVGCTVINEDPGALDQQELERERKSFASRAWLFRNERGFTHSHQARFGWGNVRVDFSSQDGIIRDVVVFSDGLDADSFDGIPQLLVGARTSVGELEERLRAGGIPDRIAIDVAHLIADGSRL